MAIPHPGGASSHIVDSFNFLSKKNKVKLYCASESKSDVGGRKTNTILLPAKILFKIIKCKILYKTRKADLDICHDVYALLAITKKNKLALYVHGELSNEIRALNPSTPLLMLNLLRRLERVAYQKADYVVAVDTRIANHVKDISPNSKVFSLSNFINIPELIDKPRQIEKDIIVNITRRHVEKNGVKFALEAVRKVQSRRTGLNIVCNVYGDGPLNRSLRDEFESDKIIFHGAKKREVVISSLKKGHICIIPSVPVGDYIEATSISVLESCLYGNITIASSIGGIVEIFSNASSDSCYFTEPKNVDSIVNTLKTIINNNNIAYSIAQNGQNHIIKNYNITEYYQNLSKIVNTPL